MTALRLETNRALTEAIGLYRAAGYREVAAFSPEPYAHHWFEKTTSVQGSGAARRGEQVGALSLPESTIRPVIA